MSNSCQHRNSRDRFNLKSVFIHESISSGSKVNFSRWSRRPFWILPSGKKRRDFWEGQVAYLKKGSRKSKQSSNHLSQTMVTELRFMALLLWSI